jgi:hypothetical protein
MLQAAIINVLRSLILLHYLYTDVTVPYIVAMILETDVTLVILTTAVVEEVKCKRPIL